MNRRGACVPLLLLAGCQDVLGLDHLANQDATASVSCAPGGTALLCADFEQATPVAFDDGISTALPVANPGATAALCMPGSASPSALCVDAQGASYTFGPDGEGTAIAHLHASFDVKFVQGAPYAFEVVAIGIAGSQDADCVANLQLDPGQGVRLMTDCAGSRKWVVLLPGPPTDWAHYELDYDVPDARATLSVDQAAPAAIDLGQYVPVTGPALAHAGVLHQQDATGPTLELDNLIVTASP